ncbi:MAG: thiopurine S-methyltransferase [Bdellovibrionaceae bacterium]|nr:thiopurine S-methyltransferase [Pseudobdellovibrionaceae bacterium]
MDPNFWLEIWEKNETPFHQFDYNRLLVKYWSSLNLEKGTEIFIPFCGKSKDMLWLKNQGYKILGNELSELATKQFFKENNLDFETDFDKNFSINKSDQIKIMIGDYFSLTPDHTSQVRAVFDRASLIALPSNLRKKYVNQMKNLLVKDCIILLITLEYEKETVTPPPFDVRDKEIYELYGSWSKITKLETLNANIKEKDGFETVYRIEVKNP